MDVDVLIFGGGAAGLWLVDALSRRGERVLLLEAGQLGQGQTIASQGIIHGGLKYTLQGLLTPAAREIRDMPEIWRQCLAGERAPDLRNTRLRAASCHLWRSDSLRSRLGMLGARIGLHARAPNSAAADRPAVFAGCPGTVALLAEQVIVPASFIADLAGQHREQLLRIEPDKVRFVLSGAGVVKQVAMVHPESGEELVLQPGRVVLAAGAGNLALRTHCGLSSGEMQKRPLHMLLVRGNLPVLNGHCVDGARTRVTITSDQDSEGRTVWQVGGQLAEDGVVLDESQLVRRARDELKEVLPGVEFSDCEWAAYRVDRAESAMPRGGRPDTATVLSEGNIITAWPTKLALVPQLTRMVEAYLPPSKETGAGERAFDLKQFEAWPRPQVALPPWETPRTWHRHVRECLMTNV